MSEAIATFGSGGAEPYARALERDGGVLYLHAVDGSVAAMDLRRWSRDADTTDRNLLSRVRGPVLDVGCGPGRMVKAATSLGLRALGVDVSPTVVGRARALGLNVVRASIFDRVPDEGAWRSALLVDGNIGIGGEPGTLLARCRDVLHPRGEIVVETHPRAERDRAFFGAVVGEDGRQSDVFPWAEVGIAALVRIAAGQGLRAVQRWESAGRTFCRLRMAR